MLLVLLAASCAAPAVERAPAPARDEVLGAPPAREDDPFASFVLPADARPAPTSGTIGAAIPSEPDAGPARPGCYSCVRICPQGGEVQGGGAEACAARGADLICGWGSADDVALAGRRARAECDAALAMARKMGSYRSIEGACPEASCEAPAP